MIPVYNECDCIDGLWLRLGKALNGLSASFEVIFVDDGSTDDSLQMLTRIGRSDPRVRVVRLLRNTGQTAALAAGFRSARGTWVATLDADLQNPPEEIGRLIEVSEGVDIVYGRRRKRNDSWAKRIGSRIGNGVRNTITGHHVRDTGCSLKLMRRTALMRIPLLTGMHRFLPTLFAFHGFKTRELDVAHENRAAGISKYGNLGRAWHGLYDCFAVRWMRSRGLRYECEEIDHGPVSED